MTEASQHSIRARFETRTSGERAVEHLVQQLGIARTAIEIGPEGRDNSTGTKASGGDLGSDRRSDPPLEGPLIVALRGAEDRDDAAAALTEAGGVLIA